VSVQVSDKNSPAFDKVYLNFEGQIHREEENAYGNGTAASTVIRSSPDEDDIVDEILVSDVRTVVICKNHPKTICCLPFRREATKT